MSSEMPTTKEKEMMALGASLAAGCVPCTDYHVRALRQAGGSDQEARKAASIGLAIKREALAVMTRRASEVFGLDEPEQAAFADAEPCRVAQLVSIASAVAAQCAPVLDRQIASVQQQGLDGSQVRLALEVGKMVREMAGRKTDEVAHPFGESSSASPCGCADLTAPPAEASEGKPCGCES